MFIFCTFCAEWCPFCNRLCVQDIVVAISICRRGFNHNWPLAQCRSMESVCVYCSKSVSQNTFFQHYTCVSYTSIQWIIHNNNIEKFNYHIYIQYIYICVLVAVYIYMYTYTPNDLCVCVCVCARLRLLTSN